MVDMIPLENRMMLKLNEASMVTGIPAFRIRQWVKSGVVKSYKPSDAKQAPYFVNMQSLREYINSLC